MRSVFFCLALSAALGLFGCPKPPTPPPAPPRATDAAPALPQCPTALDITKVTACTGLFHAGDLMPCADCTSASAQACVFARAAVWCVFPSCGADPACSEQPPTSK